MKALVVGSTGMIGARLVEALRRAKFDVVGTTRTDLDLECVPEYLQDRFGSANVVYLCAAMTRFIDCEQNEAAYRINVDAPAEIARQYQHARVVYLSSEAVERALHTNYGMHKALAEQALRAVCKPTIVRLSKVGYGDLDQVCSFLIGLAHKKPGLYRWKASDEKSVAIQEPTFKKHASCADHPHGCRMVSDGLVCQGKCEWQQAKAAA